MGVVSGTISHMPHGVIIVAKFRRRCQIGTGITAAAIDRVVRHSFILEFDVPSYRTDAAQQRGQAEEVNRQV